MRCSLYITTLALLLACAYAQHSPPTKFDPHAVPLSTASCTAVNRQQDVDKTISIRYADINPSAKMTLLFVHGWPGLWSSWAPQIQDFQSEYHLVVPDQRGFGASTHPGDVASSGHMSDLVADLTCVLAHARVASAVCIGHDWGAQVCWEAARMRPDIFTAIAAAVVPYMPSADTFVPTSALVGSLPRLAYTLYFDTAPERAAAELETDVRRTLRAVMRSADTPPRPGFLESQHAFLDAWHGVDVLPPIPFLTSEEEDYHVEQYAASGFRNTLYFYSNTNRHASWEFAHAQGNLTIPQPALSILPTKDSVADWTLVAKLLRSADYVPHLTVELIETAHWPQLEKPAEFNAILRRWLAALPENMGESMRRIDDEL